MDGYYINESSIKGTLKINISNIAEFKELVKKAKSEADQLRRTIDQLSNFELNIDFSSF